MKKLTFSILAVAAFAFFSCKKEPVVVTNNPKPNDVEINKVKIVSNWMNMTFTQGTKYNEGGLEATHHFNPSTIYNDGETTRIAFVRTSDAYRALPATLDIADARLDVSFLLTLASFSVMVSDAGGTGIPAISSMDNCQFRYIVVSNSILNGLDVDLADYSSVAAALNIED
jgi:hypothetical protein